MASNLEILLRHSGGLPSYALLDGAGIDNLYARLEALDAPFVSLLNGWSATAYLRVSPFLVRIERAAPRAEKLIDDGISVGGLVWLASSQPLERIRSRLFKFYYWRHGKNHVYARIADAMYFSSLMKIANADQCKMLGAIAEQIVIPQHGRFNTFAFDVESGRHHRQENAREEVS